MANPKQIPQLIEETVAKVLESRVAGLKQEVSSAVMAAIAPALEAHAASAKSGEEEGAGGGPIDLLFAATSSIYDAGGQKEILTALLDGVAQFSPRAALFVLRGGNIANWQNRGFDNAGALEGYTHDANSGLAGRAIRDKEAVSAAAVEFDSKFISTHGNPLDGNATVLPLVVREKVAAVVYSDAGKDAAKRFDLSAVRLLVRAAASWLEIQALRKSAGVESAAPEAMASAAAAPVEAAPPPAAAHVAAAAATASAAPDTSGLSTEDQEVHKKAKRFAKLLVDEIKLYNQAKVTEGRQNRNLYSLLQEDIDKSRNTYEKRYGSTVAAEAKYFDAEVVRILADNDPAMMGAGFGG